MLVSVHGIKFLDRDEWRGAGERTEGEVLNQENASLRPAVPYI